MSKLLIMDNKQFVDAITRQLGQTDKQTQQFIDAFTKIVCEQSAELNSIAIPSFGTFQAIKENEHVVRDLSTGQRLLVPPSITLKFTAATALNKKIIAQ